MTRLLQTLLVLGVVGCARSEKAEPTLDPNRPESTPIAATEVERTDTSPPPPAAPPSGAHPMKWRQYGVGRVPGVDHAAG